MTRVCSARWVALALWAGCSSGGASSDRTTEVSNAEPRLLVTRVVASWCGTCRVLAQHSAELLPSSLAVRVRYVDIVLADEDNAPANSNSAVAWRDTFAPEAEAELETKLPLRELFSERHRPLPWVVVQREGSDAVLAALTNPRFDLLKAALEDALQVARSPTAELLDARFDPFEQALISAMRLSDKPPADPGNEVGDDPRAASFGRKLFFERALSPSNVSCGGCHDPTLLLTDGKGVPPEGAGRGVRNVPSIALASRARWQLWDGRSDSLAAQALLPFEDVTEFNSSRLFVAHAVASRYEGSYRELFGNLPTLDDHQRFPATGKPGDSAWAAMAEPDRQAVTKLFVNVGKALAAFERSIQVLPNALDRYLDGDRAALSELQKDGLAAFLRAGCAQCHYGERLTDDAFHNLRFPTGHGDGSADIGRADGIVKFAAAELRKDDARATALNTAEAIKAGEGAFKTAGLRGVAFTLPYGHGGAYGGLTSVIEAHRTCGLPAGSSLTVGECEPWVSDFQLDDARASEDFLRALRLDMTGVDHRK